MDKKRVNEYGVSYDDEDSNSEQSKEKRAKSKKE